MKFQGRWYVDAIRDVTGLDSSYFTMDKLESYGNANLLKGGIVYSDYITTVSETYAKEIQSTEGGDESFGVMPELLTRAEFVTKLTAVCAKCGAPATRTQRLVDGKPASFEDPVVLIGAVEHYEPRCRHCHEVRNRPNKF